MFRRQVLTAEQLVRCDSRALDQLFRSAAHTQSPRGRGAGTVLFGGTLVANRVAALMARPIWRGKIVDADGRALRNLVTPLALPAFRAMVYDEDSWVDGSTCTVLDYSRTSLLVRKIRDEIREVAPGLYLGVVFWGRRRVLHFCLDFAARVR